MAKIIYYDKEAREKLLKGIDAVADVVKETLGPSGMNIAVEKKFSAPQILNDGVSKGKNARNQFLIYLEDAGRSIRTQVDINCRSFFGCFFVNDNPVVPNDSDEFIRRRCNIRFADSYADEIDIACQMQWGNRLSELKSIIQSINLK